MSSQDLAAALLISKCANAISSGSCIHVVSYNKGVVVTAGVLGVI